MAAEFSFINGAQRVIVIDFNWRLEFMRKKYPAVETIDFGKLKKGESVTKELMKMCSDRGPDVSIECAAGEYAKTWSHCFEILMGLETDTSEIVNEMITSTRNFGRCGITGVYVGYTNHFNIGSLMERGIRLIGNGQAPVHMHWEKLLKMIQDGKIKPLNMVSHRVRLEDLDKVYYKFEAKEDGMQKLISDNLDRFIAQVYGLAHETGYPKRRLFGFARIDLAAGNKKEIELSVSLRSLQR
ncbi:hypothetical protein N0V94_004541 [Neodidymelliopsis sp. IMI 364377]|nr:hypothetical protein N0V94_004541 [Neodidymelliopsis sp. IMI 364377]